MSYLLVSGTVPLQGEVRIQGAKNSVLPILAASLLSADECRLCNCPRLRDVDAAIRILSHLGCRVWWEGDCLSVDSRSLTACDIPDELMREMRSSVIFLGAILARMGHAEISYPGGCELGPRPIDLHLNALQTLGAKISDCGGGLRCCCTKLHAAEIFLSVSSVGATENAILAACGADGTSVIHNAAREPEIVDLQNFLRAMGAQVYGAGSSVITVTGGRVLHGCTYAAMADRIVASTYLCAAAAAGGEVRLHGVDYRTFSTVAAALNEAGCRLQSDAQSISLTAAQRLRAIRPVRTAPYPGFPTDAQPLLMAALLKSAGSTVFVENIFENRYRHVDELTRMGADIRTAGRVAVISGVQKLHGASVCCTDLRGGAALVLAALSAEGESCIRKIHHIERGYASLDEDLRSLGASVKKIDDE